MRTVVSYPGTMAHAQQSARALWEVGSLESFVTTFAHLPSGRLASLLRRVPGSAIDGVLRQLARRSISEVPPEFIRSYPGLEVLRTLAARAGAGPVAVDRIWDWMSHSFDGAVARSCLSRADAVMAFEYTALATFEEARLRGVARILQLPSRDSRETEAIRTREQARWPRLARSADPYFQRKFARRQDRRLAEIAAADLVIANSALTARSHMAAGADPIKMAVVPLAAPPALDPASIREPSPNGPLAVLWAGPFSFRKGAHYVLEAWRILNAGSAARLDIYGPIELPFDLVGGVSGLVFHGAVPQRQLFDAYGEADVLAFPTLSDGFGMVVLEAMAHGLPVIVTNEAGAAEAVTAANGLIVPAADPDALAEALRWCLDNRQRLAAMRGPALETARARQWPDYRRDLVAVLEAGLTRAGYTPTFGGLP